MKCLMALVLTIAMLLCAVAVAEQAPGGELPARGGEMGEGFTGEKGERPDGEFPGGKGERPDGDFPDGGRQGGGMAQSDAETDEELQAILDEVLDQYELMTFADPETGIELQYQLFAPEGCEEGGEYPLVMFIPDSRAPGREASYVLTIGWGGVIWATAEEQAKHPCFVMVPVFTETVVDDNFNTSEQIEVAVRII